jgi:hypothetical protein
MPDETTKGALLERAGAVAAALMDGGFIAPLPEAPFRRWDRLTRQPSR